MSSTEPDRDVTPALGAALTATDETTAREHLGRLVRETWAVWAQEQPDPKPSWLLGWEDLDEGQREVDMRIGETVAAQVKPDAMWENAYMDVQRVLDKALGTEEEDGAGSGIAGDVWLLAAQRDEARAEVERLRRKITEAAAAATAAERERIAGVAETMGAHYHDGYSGQSAMFANYLRGSHHEVRG